MATGCAVGQVAAFSDSQRRRSLDEKLALEGLDGARCIDRRRRPRCGCRL